MNIKLTTLSWFITATFSLSLYAADSVYNYTERGAIADSVYYNIGGGTVTGPSISRNKPGSMGLSLGWQSNLMCGNFDVKTTVKNQLNGATSGFKDLMGNVIQSATGAVMSLPAMIIQRANPQLYDLLTNGVLQGKVDFGNVKMSCEQMARKAADYADNAGWFESAKLQNYMSIASKEKDAVVAEQKASQEAAKNGTTWVGGERRGGRNQKPVKIIGDTVKAGYNILNKRSVTNKNSVPQTECKGSLCQNWTRPDELEEWVTKVAGEQEMKVCDDCGNEPPKTKAGIGLNPIIVEEQEKIYNNLADMVNGSKKVTAENLAKASGGSLVLTRGVVESLKDEPDAEVLAQRLSSEMATVKVVEQALAARRALIAGMREPNVAKEEKAQEKLQLTLEQLDKELAQIKLELDLRKALADNAATTIIERRVQRDEEQGRLMPQQTDVDKIMTDLNTGAQ